MKPRSVQKWDFWHGVGQGLIFGLCFVAGGLLGLALLFSLLWGFAVLLGFG